MAVLKSAMNEDLHQHIFGLVDSRGRKISGEGFESEQLGEGIYRVSFQPPFKGEPGVACTVYDKSPGNSNTTIAIVQISQEDFICITSTNSGFSFMAFGDVHGYYY